MNSHLKYCLLFLLFTGILTAAYSQPVKDPDLKVIARPLQDSILLRWAPVNYNTWQLGNEYGYSILRYTIIRNNELLPKPEAEKLNTVPIAPLPLAEWEKYVLRNKYAAVAAQALYGETFEIDAGKGFNPRQMYLKSEEQRQRLSFALYVSDISPEVARISGLWYTDETTNPDEKYLYKIFINMPAGDKIKPDTAYVFTAFAEHRALPAPVELAANFNDRLVELHWNAFVQNDIYIAYWVERSDDNGRTFHKIHDEPLVQIMPQEGGSPELIYKMDSLPENDKEFLYRVQGITSFGEVGPYSEVVSGMGKSQITGFPVITKQQHVENKRVEITWEFPPALENQLDGFQIVRAKSHDSNFLEISSVASNVRKFLDEAPLMTSYYKVIAYKQNRESRESYPVLVQLTDSIPPAIPTGFTGIADTTGLVQLTWQPNQEDDIFGYRIYRSRSGNDEFTQITTRPVKETIFTDSIPKKDINKTVFYKILAVDQRQNESQLSKMLAVEKPDKIPPSAPVFTIIKPTETGIQLAWINSSSADVIGHILYRIQTKDSSYSEIAKFDYDGKKMKSEYLDEEPGDGQVQYKLVAMDKAGNLSQPAISIAVSPVKSLFKAGIKNIDQTYDSKNGKLYLSWKMPKDPVDKFIVYRKTEVKNYSIYESVPGSNNHFEDYGMKAGEIYAYKIKVVYTDGSFSSLSDEVMVKF